MNKKDIQKEAKNLLKRLEGDKYKMYDSDWQDEAVVFLNNYYMEEDPEMEIYDIHDELFEHIVSMELERGGVGRLFYLLGQIEPSNDWCRLNAYGNAVPITGSDLVDEIRGLSE